jgi:hypothetical protein
LGRLIKRWKYSVLFENASADLILERVAVVMGID